MVFVNPIIELALVSIAMSFVTQIIQRKFGNRDQMKEHQEKMKTTQKRVKELMTKEDEKSKQERESLEKEMLDSMNTVMKASMKTMVVSMAIVIPVFFLMGAVYEEEIIDLPLPVPWIGTQADLLNPFSWFELYEQTNWIGWYILVSLLFSLLILSPLIKVYEKMKKREKGN